jgi:hypothetical protein
VAYPFVAAPDNWPRGGVPVKAIVIHHAEGGGTVSWLTRDDGNSSHYVVEYTGRVVQMVLEDRAAGSINPTLVRTDDDPPFIFEGESVTYGVTANKAALGDDWHNPNAAVIAIEVEGFAKDGPNANQRTALRSLVVDIRSRHPGVAALGHRDFQSYKACPGRKVPWLDYGGHGLFQEEPVTMQKFKLGLSDPIGTYTLVADDLIIAMDESRIPVKAGRTGNVFAEVTLPDARPALLVGYDDTSGLLVNDARLLYTPAPVAAAPVKYPVVVGGKAVGEVELP